MARHDYALRRFGRVTAQFAHANGAVPLGARVSPSITGAARLSAAAQEGRRSGHPSAGKLQAVQILFGLWRACFCSSLRGVATAASLAARL
eukprot:10200612-Alexandrium_andersonii.AAC.1